MKSVIRAQGLMCTVDFGGSVASFFPKNDRFGLCCFRSKEQNDKCHPRASLAMKGVLWGAGLPSAIRSVPTRWRKASMINKRMLRAGLQLQSIEPTKITGILMVERGLDSDHNFWLSTISTRCCGLCPHRALFPQSLPRKGAASHRRAQQCR
mmetsp:Transcript_17982/g.59042  ORF Transcript_17982/g.59042 Transcript_17982/m.59042 type:complete len:152 (-) Transcript_17982:8-463(-)